MLQLGKELTLSSPSLRLITWCGHVITTAFLNLVELQLCNSVSVQLHIVHLLLQSKLAVPVYINLLNLAVVACLKTLSCLFFCAVENSEQKFLMCGSQHLQTLCFVKFNALGTLFCYGYQKLATTVLYFKLAPFCIESMCM